MERRLTPCIQSTTGALRLSIDASETTIARLPIISGEKPFGPFLYWAELGRLFSARLEAWASWSFALRLMQPIYLNRFNRLTATRPMPSMRNESDSGTISATPYKPKFK